VASLTPESAPRERASFAPGTLLAGRYEIEREIGRGGMAEVFAARDRLEERRVAVKVLRPDLAHLVGADRFLREIAIAGRVQHEHVLHLLDSGHSDETPPRPYYVMPLVEGETLRARMDRERQLPVAEVVRLARAVAAALQHAHGLGLIHRDIKPENILLGGDQVLVADFGIAHAATAAGGETLTQTGMVLGTPPYMSPEQGGANPVDARSDLYSLGCVLYEMLVGEPPFTGRSTQAIIARHMYDHPPSIEVVRPEVPAGLVQVVTRLLAKSPADRFPSAAALDAALAGALEPARAVAPARTGTVLGRIGAIAGVAIAGWLAWAVVGPKPILDPRRVTVFPLVDQRQGGADGNAGEIVALMLATTLGQAEPLRGLYGWVALGPRERADPRLVSASSARSIAKRQKAGYYVTGWIQGENDSIAVILSLNDASGRDDPVQRRVSAHLGDRSPTQLGLAAMVELLPSLLGHETDLRILSDRKPAAIEEFLLGEVEYYRARFGAALKHYHKAIETDSALAIAAVRGAQAASWAEQPEEALRLVAVADQHAGALSSQYLALVKGLSAYYAGQADSAVTYLREAVAAAPDWGEAWMALGEVYRHLLPRERPLDSLAEAAFAQASALDSSFTPSLYHLAELAIQRGDLPRARRLASRLEAADTDSGIVRPLKLMLRCFDRGISPAEWRRVAATDWIDLTAAALVLAAPAASPSCATDAFRAVMEEPQAGGSYRPNAYFALQSLLAMQGRNEELGRLLASEYGTQFSGAWYVVLASVAGAPFEREADSLALTQGTDYSPMGTVRLWFLGLWEARRGDVGRLRIIETSLARKADSSGSRQDRLLSDIIAAHAALARGDSADAVRRLAALRAVTTRTQAVWSGWGALSFEHLALARLLQAAGDQNGALAEVATFDAPAPPITSWLCQPGAYVVGVRAAEALGKKDLAARYRARLRAIGRESLLQ
jgi:eukaryotic-like serine/threonine-protein kinase